MFAREHKHAARRNGRRARLDRLRKVGNATRPTSSHLRTTTSVVKNRTKDPPTSGVATRYDQGCARGSR